MKKLILFDIDGTLIHTGGAGTRSMDLAFRELFGVDKAFKDISMAGKTDIQIMREGLSAHGLPGYDGKLDSLMEAYLRFLETEINNPMRTMKPGVLKVLELLSDIGAPLGLLTGNIEKGARIKLEAFGLNGYFPDGAFGSDHEDRDMLLPFAIEKFSRIGLRFRPGDCIIIGDTPRDVKCARVHGARCIAVATGPYPKEDLLATDADVVFDTLEDVDRCMEFMNRPD